MNGGEGGGWRLRGSLESVKVIIESFRRLGMEEDSSPTKPCNRHMRHFTP